MEEHSGQRRTEEAIVAIIGLILLFQLLSGLIGVIGNSSGGGFIASFLGLHPSLTDDSPLGTAVINRGRTTLYSEPGGEAIGVLPSDAQGVTVGGPVLRDGELWWEVEYENGSRGWVKNSDIGREIDRDKRLLKESTPRGTEVVHVADTDVFSDPRNGTVIARARIGNQATIVGGPVDVNGQRYWQVKYDNGVAGWVSESSLEIDVPRDRNRLNDATPFGTLVKTLADGTEIWSAPRGGNVLGIQPRGSIGELVDGSVTIGTTRWWEIDFDFGPDGWVLEEDLELEAPLETAAGDTVDTLKKISYLISMVFVVFTVIIFVKYQKLLQEEHRRTEPLKWSPFTQEEQKDDRWGRVTTNVNSNNPNDWRLAVLEADVMLDDALKKMDLPGDTMGDKMKALTRDRLNSIDAAWEAHKVRNNVAHAGGDYILTQREAKRVVELYRQVLSELDVL